MEFLHKFHKNCVPYVGYPGNHNFYVCKGKIIPNKRLASRFKTITTHYPKNLNSFLDLSSCRGYFVLSASQQPHSHRNLGIDINAEEINICKNLKKQFNLPNSQFEIMTLLDLAQNIDNFGSAFQTVLLANTYQYLYFGSDFGLGYGSHEKIFDYINQVCSERFIFTNRAEEEHCQNRTQVESSGELAKNYNREAILKAASRYFKLSHETKIGKYPLWVFDKI